MIPQTVFVLEVCLYRVQVVVCVLSLWFGKTPTMSVLWWVLLQEQGELGISGLEWIIRVASLDILFRFERCGGCHISSARVFKGLKHSCLLAVCAYLRQSTGLYLAASGCIVLIFLWPLSAFLLREKKRWQRHPFPIDLTNLTDLALWWCFFTFLSSCAMSDSHWNEGEQTASAKQ